MVRRGVQWIGVAWWLILATGYGIAAWRVVFQLRLGPVVAPISASRGVHQGDVLGIAALAMALTCAVVAIGVLPCLTTVRRGPGLP